MSDGIRQTETADVVRLQQVEHDAASLYQGWPGIDPVVLQSVISLSEHLLSIEEGLSLVLEENNRIAGFAMGDRQGPDAYLRELSVARDFQQRGHGAKLVRAFIATAHASGARDIYLATFRTPPWNAPFYRRLSFHDVDPADYLPWMIEMEAVQSTFLDLSTRVFMKLR